MVPDGLAPGPAAKTQAPGAAASAPPGAGNWSRLGTDVMSICCEWLTPEDVRHVRLVCRGWRQAVKGALATLTPTEPFVSEVARRFPSLRYLDMSRCRKTLGDDDLVGVARLPGLRRLSLAGCERLTDAALAHVTSGVPGLYALDLSGLPISDHALATLGGGPPRYPAVVSPPRPRSHSPALLLGRLPASPPRLTCMLPVPDPPGALPLLCELTLSGCVGLSAKGLAALGPVLGRLRRLSLASCGSAVDDAALGVLGSTCRRLEELDLAGCLVTDSGLAHLAPLGGTLRALGLWNCMHVGEDGLHALTALCGLERLCLRGWQQLTDAGIAHLAALPALHALDMRACEQLRGEGFAALQPLRRLRVLDLRRCHGLIDVALGGIGSLHALRRLLLDGCWQLTGAGLAPLGALTSLEELSLLGCRGVWMPDGSSLPGLGSLRALRTLVLRSCDRLAWDALGFLAPGCGGSGDAEGGLPALETLDISSCHLLRGDDLRVLPHLPVLRTLRAEHCMGLEGPEALDWVGRCEHLTALYLCGCRKLHGAALGALRDLHGLQTLSLHGCHGVPALDAGLEAMLGPDSHPALRTLSLQGCDSISDAGVGALRHLRGLRALHLSDCGGIVGGGFAVWQPRPPPHLSELHLQNCHAIGDAGCASIARLGSLRELRLKACRAVSAAGLAALARGLPALAALSLQNMSLTDDGVVPLAELTNLTSLELQFCWKLTDTGILALTSLRHLQRLDLLYSWQVTDGVLERLVAMPSLRRLNLAGCHRISETGRASIAHLLPRDQTQLV